MWWMVAAVMFVVAPSPKTQDRLVMVPVEASVNVTSRGAVPLVGEPVKLATGTIAPVPVIGLVEVPAVLMKMALSLNTPSAVGVKRMTTLVEAKAAMVNGLPE